ncbi:MAG: V-type ATPase subunit subunit G family protein [Actinomycetota bacterium]|nr:V-type ATPase subunit subunit G family protein [Actinomycetota bacterium]
MAEAKVNKEEIKEGYHAAQAILEMIMRKEEEIRRRVKEAQEEASRRVEEAKLDAAVLKREAVSAELKQEMREKELAKAKKEVERLISEAKSRAEEIRSMGEEQLNDAVQMILEGILTPVQKEEKELAGEALK